MSKDDRHWNRCDDCGRFIPMAAFHDGTAKRAMVTPDTAFTAETYVTICPACVKKEAR